MPTYSYSCDSCNYSFELFSTISNYNPQPKCSRCQKSKTHRRYLDDVSTISTSIKKSDSELKTIGDLALRNSERMSEDQKISLRQKHNAYKDNKEESGSLPSGMSRIKKPPKTSWAESSCIKKKRSPKQ